MPTSHSHTHKIKNLNFEKADLMKVDQIFPFLLIIFQLSKRSQLYKVF